MEEEDLVAGAEVAKGAEVAGIRGEHIIRTKRQSSTVMMKALKRVSQDFQLYQISVPTNGVALC